MLRDNIIASLNHHHLSLILGLGEGQMVNYFGQHIRLAIVLKDVTMGFRKMLLNGGFHAIKEGATLAT